MTDTRPAKIFPGKRWSQRMRQREVPASRRRIHNHERAGRRRHGFALEIADNPARHFRPDAPESNFLSQLEPIHHQNRSGEHDAQSLHQRTGPGVPEDVERQRQATTPILPTPNTYGEATHSPRQRSAPGPARSTRSGNTRLAGSSSPRARAHPDSTPITPTMAAPALTRAAALEAGELQTAFAEHHPPQVDRHVLQEQVETFSVEPPFTRDFTEQRIAQSQVAEREQHERHVRPKPTP